MNNKQHIPPSSETLIQQADALLPQMQCKKCSYPGCLPYAQAIVEKNEAINRCAPGGVKTLKALANLLKKEAEPFLEEIQQKESPPMVAIIHELDCIGCTKCIQACPVDAIVGAPKQLHGILKEECTGCELCVVACPVDCIEMQILPVQLYKPKQAKRRFYAKKQRLEKEATPVQPETQEDRVRHYVEAALARAREKKLKGPN